MASFFEDLWSSIFTEGATPTLIVATNATFAALQLLFFVLLVATYSIHFVILSFLSAALWWSINWFVAELKSVREKEAKEKKPTKEPDQRADTTFARTPGTIDMTDSETETESIVGGPSRDSKKRLPKSASAVGGVAARRSPAPARGSTPSASGVQGASKPEASAEVRQRNAPGDSSGYISTDSEWEKVEEDR